MKTLAYKESGKIPLTPQKGLEAKAGFCFQVLLIKKLSYDKMPLDRKGALWGEMSPMCGWFFGFWKRTAFRR